MLSRVVEELRRLSKPYAWVVREALLARKRNVVFVLALTAAGAIAQGSTIAFIALALSQLEAPTGLGIPFVDDWITNRFVMLSVFACCLLALTLLGVWAVYSSAVRVRQLARSFHWKCFSRSVEMSFRTTSLSGPMPRSEAAFRRLILRNSNQLGKSVEALVGLASPLFRVVVASAILFWIDAMLTLVLIPLFFFLAPVLYRVVAGVREPSRRFFEDAVSRMGTRVSEVLRLSNGQHAGLAPPYVRWLEDRYCADSSVLEYFDRYDEVQLAKERVQLFTGAVNSLLLVCALLVGGYLAATESLEWGRVVAYLVALLQVTNSGKATVSLLTNLSIFYPAVSQSFEFLGSSRGEPFASGATPTLSDSRTTETAVEPARALDGLVVSSSCGIPGSRECVRVEPGAPVVYCPEAPLDRLHLDLVVEPLCRATRLPRRFWTDESCFLTQRGFPRPGVLRLHLAGEADPARDARGETLLREAGLGSLIDELETGLDTELTADSWARLPADTRLALGLVSVAADPRSVVFIDHRVFRGVEKDTVSRSLRLLRSKFLFIVPSGVGFTIPLSGMDAAIVVKEGQVAGVGDLEWFERIGDGGGEVVEEREDGEDELL